MFVDCVLQATLVHPLLVVQEMNIQNSCFHFLNEKILRIQEILKCRKEVLYQTFLTNLDNVKFVMLKKQLQKEINPETNQSPRYI